MLRYCVAHEDAVADNRRDILSPHPGLSPEFLATPDGVKFLKFLAAEKKRKKK